MELQDVAAMLLDTDRRPALLNLHDTTADVELPAPAVYDSNYPSVTPDEPRIGRVGLSPEQARLLVYTA